MPFTKTGPFTNGSYTPSPLSAGFANGVEAALDAVANRRGSVSVTEYGAVLDGINDDTTAIQTALNSGADVIIAGTPSGPGIARTTATLLMNVNAPGQRLLTRNATIQPAFLGDCIQVTTRSTVSVAITGALQPSSGDFSRVAAIRIGGTSAAYNPMQAAAPYCDIRNFKGSGIIWDHGAMIDFTHTFISDVTIDGFTTGQAFDDNNHGNFVNTHVIRAGRWGYATVYPGTFIDAYHGSAGYSSAAHQFFNAKAFGCGQNFHIETHSNIGTVFSEQSGTPDSFGPNSRTNDINVLGTVTAFEGWVDNGPAGSNHLAGYGNGDYRVNKTVRTRQLQLGSAVLTSGTTAVYTVSSTTIANGVVAVVNPGVTGLGTNTVVQASFFTASSSGVLFSHFIDAGGVLHFQLANLSGTSQTVSGVVSYVIYTFA